MYLIAATYSAILSPLPCLRLFKSSSKSILSYCFTKRLRKARSNSRQVLTFRFIVRYQRVAPFERTHGSARNISSSDMFELPKQSLSDCDSRNSSESSRSSPLYYSPHVRRSLTAEGFGGGDWLLPAEPDNVTVFLLERLLPPWRLFIRRCLFNWTTVHTRPSLLVAVCSWSVGPCLGRSGRDGV